jgi:hypothetical protein
LRLEYERFSVYTPLSLGFVKAELWSRLGEGGGGYKGGGIETGYRLDIGVWSVCECTTEQ